MGCLRMKRMPTGMPEKSSFSSGGKFRCLVISGMLASFSTLPIMDQRSDHRQKGNGIDPVRPFQPKRGDHQPAQCRTNDGAGIGCDRLQTKCALQVFARHNVGDQRLPRGTIKGDRRPPGLQPSDVDRPDGYGSPE